MAAATAAAELEVSRDFEPNWVSQRLGSLLGATNEELLGSWLRHGFGVVRFLASAGSLDGVSNDGAVAKHEGWSLARTSSGARLRQASRDMGDFSSSLHLLTWR